MWSAIARRIRKRHRSTASTNLNPDDTVIACTDEEIVGQTVPLSSLHIERNPLCFIYRLPTEILEAIFIQCARDYFRAFSGHPIATVPDWVNVSYVSCHWRNVALNCPALWTYLFVASPRWTAALLARSKQMSLKVDVNLHRWDEKRHRSFRFVEQVMDHVEHIQDLYLDLSMHNLHQVLSKLSSRAPRLQRLEINAIGYPPEWSTLPFDGDTPALRILRLERCPVPWYSLNLSGLTLLSLLQVPVRFQQHTAEFLATLSSMRNLQYLYLVDALASATGFLSSTSSRNFQKVDLPRLSHFSIIAPLSTVIALLSYINIPLETEVTLGPDYGFQGDFSSLNDYAPLYSLLAKRYGMESQDRAPSFLTIRSLVIEYSGTEYEWAKLSFRTLERDCDSCPSVPCMEWGCTIRFQILLAFRQPSIHRNRLISRICCSMPLSHVRSVHVLNPPFSLAFWTDVLGRLRNLRYIKLSNGIMPNLASALSLTLHDFTENQDGQADRGQSQILAPALEELQLDGILFSTAFGGDMNPLEATDLQSLCDALSTRKEPRGRLRMTSCYSVKRTSDRQLKVFDMEGWWEGGRFCVISPKDDDHELERLDTS